MAVTITIDEIIADLRLADTPAQRGLAQRRLDYATVAVTKYAPTAPEIILNEAVSRLAGYLFDQPTVAGGAAFTNALRNSGASNILMPYRIHGLGYAEAMDEVNQAVGSVGNPVTGLTIVGDQLTVTFADGTEEVLMLPAGMGGGGGMFSGVDHEARMTAAEAVIAAANAQITADGNTASIDALPTPQTVPDVPAVYTRGNTDIIPKQKISHAAPNQYLVISNVGTIIGISGQPGGGGGGGGGAEVLETIIRLKTARTTYNFGSAVTITDLTITADNFEIGEKWLILYHVNFTVGSNNSNSFRAEATLLHGAGQLDVSYIENEDSAGGTSVAGGTATGIAILNLLAAPEDITVRASWSSNINLRYVESGSSLLAIKLSGLASGGIDEGAVDGRISALISNWAFSGNTAEIPAGKFPFAIPNWLAAPLTHDIPFSLLNTTLHSWTEGVNNLVIPDDKLPVERFVPDASGATDGQVAKVDGGVWTIGDDEQGTGGGGGGGELEKTATAVTRITFSEGMVANVALPTANVAVDSGIAVPDNTKTILINYGASKNTTTSGIDLVWYPIPIEEWERLDAVAAGGGPTQGNARFTRTWRQDDITAIGGTGARQVWFLKGGNGNIFLMTDNTAWGMHPLRVRFEIHESVDVLSDVTGGGGEGGGLTAAGISGLDQAASNQVHSNAFFPGVFGGVLRRFSFGNLIALMRSTVGLGRQINPTGSDSSLGKIPVLQADGANFHYQLQHPAELPTIASNVPNTPASMNPAILYKDTPVGDTATAIYYKRRHDRESVIIAINDTSPRSFGTEHRSFGWTNRIILDTAEPVPGVNPYPSTPPHWQAFIRVQNIASGLYEWRLYTDEMFTTETTIYLDMRDQDDPDTHIQNVAMTKPVNEAYWSTGTYNFTVFPFYGIAGRGRRPVIRIRNADDTLSTSIIHLIPVDDVREGLVDDDRLHEAYGDLLDIMSERFDNVGGGKTAAIFRSGGEANLSQVPISTSSFLLTIPAADLRGGQTYLLMGECDAQMGLATGGWVETHMQAFAGSTSFMLDRERTQPVTTLDNPRHTHSHFTTWECPATPVDVRLAMRWTGTATLSTHGFSVTHSRLILIPIEAM